MGFEEMRALLKYPSVHEALLYEKQRNDEVRCGLCERRCRISPGQRGFCKTRGNVDGRLYTLVYGDIASISANPIEKKPFFHFWPGSYALTIGTWSCNFTCPWCQNSDLSAARPRPAKARYLASKQFVKMIGSQGCQGSSISFNEPTMLFEYSLDVFSHAHRKGWYNTFVSNGYMTLEALHMLQDAGMDAIKFDLKGNEECVQQYCEADVNVVWRNVRAAKRLRLHVEVVTLVIPDVNDDDDCLRAIARRHIKEAGGETPLHFTQFYPTYQMTDRPSTAVETLEKAHRLATREGVHYVYAGNVPGHRLEDTYCPSCGALLIGRFGFTVTQMRLTHDKSCPRCGRDIPIIGDCRGFE